MKKFFLLVFLLIPAALFAQTQRYNKVVITSSATDALVVAGGVSAPTIGTSPTNRITIPIATDTLVLLAANQTLTNKTLTSPVINGWAGSTSITTVGTITTGTWSGLFGAVTGANLTHLTAGNIDPGTITATFVGNLTGNSSTAAALQTARTINGVSFDGTAPITVTAAAGTLTGTTLAANVLASSLTSVGTLTSGATGAGFTVGLGTSIITGTLGVSNGGTGAGTLTGVLRGNGTGAFTAVAVPGNTTTFLRGDFTFAVPTVTVSDSTITFTDITTGNASTSQHGFLPKLDGNAYNSLRGDGSWSHTWARGTITANDPFSFTGTFNLGSVNFRAVEIAYGYISPPAGDTRMFSVLGGSGGATCFFKVGYDNTSCMLAVGQNGEVNTSSHINVGNGVNAFGSVSGAAIRGRVGTLASFPIGVTEGFLMTVTDSSTNVIGATITGGGANHVLAYYNGTNWVVAAK